MLRKLIETTFREKKPFTVSAIFCDGSGKVIIHSFAEDARAAHDDALMQTGGAAIIVSIFEGHLVEAEIEVTPIHEPITQIETASNCL